jgi:hypothetical protein
MTIGAFGSENQTGLRRETFIGGGDKWIPSAGAFVPRRE